MSGTTCARSSAPLSDTIEFYAPAGKSHRSILRRSPQTNGSSSPDRRAHSRVWKMPELGVLRWRAHDHGGRNFEFPDPGEKPTGRQSHPEGAPGYGFEFDRHGHLQFGFGWRDLPVCTWEPDLRKQVVQLPRTQPRQAHVRRIIHEEFIHGLGCQSGPLFGTDNCAICTWPGLSRCTHGGTIDRVLPHHAVPLAAPPSQSS